MPLQTPPVKSATVVLEPQTGSPCRRQLGTGLPAHNGVAWSNTWAATFDGGVVAPTRETIAVKSLLLLSFPHLAIAQSVLNQRVSCPFAATVMIDGIEPTIDADRFDGDHSMSSWERGRSFIFSCAVAHISDTGQ